MHTLTAKPIHKAYFEQASSEGVDVEGTFGWLMDGRFRSETEGLVIAAQDGVILTNRYKHTVLRTSTTSRDHRPQHVQLWTPHVDSL